MLRNLPPIVIERHQDVGGEHISLMLDLTVFRFPADHIVRAAVETIRMRLPVQEIVSELMREGEIDPPPRFEGTVVENAPAGLTPTRLHQRPVEARQIVAGHAQDRVFGKSRLRVLQSEFGNIDWESIGALDCVQQQGKVYRPSLLT